MPSSVIEYGLLFLLMIALIFTRGSLRVVLAGGVSIFLIAISLHRVWPVPAPPVSQADTSPPHFSFDPGKPNFVWSYDYYADIGQQITPVIKYRQLYEQAIAQGVLTPNEVAEPKPLSNADLALVHSQGYLMRLYVLGSTPLGMLNGENPISLEILRALKLACGGSYLAARIACNQGLGMNLCGGFHHAAADHEEGFCHLNDIAIAIRKLQTEGVISRAMVIDGDVHQGNGTASIFAHDPNVYTFSIHQQDNYPWNKAQSDYDVGLYSKPAVDDKRYLEALSVVAELIKDFSPQLIIYVAGADPYYQDILGGFELSKQGLRHRDEYIVGLAVGFSIPLAVVLGGGYAPDSADTVEIHLNTLRVVKAYLNQG